MRFNRFWKIIHLFLIFSLLINFLFISSTIGSEKELQSNTTNIKSIVEFTDLSNFTLVNDHPKIASYNNNVSISFLYTGDYVSSYFFGESYRYTSSDYFHDFFFSVKVTYRLRGNGQITIGIPGLVVVGIYSVNDRYRCFTYASPDGAFDRYEGSTIRYDDTCYFQIERLDSILSTKISSTFNGNPILYYSWSEGVDSHKNSFSISFNPTNVSTYYSAIYTDLFVNYEDDNIDTSDPSNLQTITLGYDSYLAVFLICLSFLVLIIRNRTKTRTKI